MKAWIAVIVIGAASYGFRLLPLVVAERVRGMARIEGTLRHAGPAAMAALSASAIRSQLLHGARPDAVVAGTLVSAALAFRRLPLLVVASAGLGVFSVIQYAH